MKNKETNFEEFEKNLRFYLKDERLKNGVSQAELARRADNLKASTVTKFESGQTPNITLKSVFEMAQASDIPLSELIKKAEANKIPNKEVPWDKLISSVNKLSDEKRNWLARLLQEALKGCVDPLK